MSIVHWIGTFPLALGFLSQVVVLACSLKRGEKAGVVQAVLLMIALALISVALLLHPEVPPILTADVLGCVSAILLLTPAVEALRKLSAKD